MEIRVLQPEDIDLLLAVEPGLFDNPSDPAQARAFLQSDLHEIAVALDAGRIVAFASGTVLLHPDKAPAMFVNEVGTRDSHLRRGLATAVCRALIDRARARGCRSVWLATEPENTQALGLYRSLDGEERLLTGFAWDGAFEGN